jgi:poly(hydroxyalkanoate) depolymerase family esterase
VRPGWVAVLAVALGLPLSLVPATRASAAGSGCVASAWPSGPAGSTPAPAPAPLLNEPGSVWFCSYTNPADGLRRTAWLYQPRGWTPATSGPLMVVLHGCTEQGPDIAYLSHFDAEAESHGFRVLYPNQAPYTQPANTPTTFDGNGSQCWNWFLPQGQQRGTGEPALIAGLTSGAAAQFATDRRRIDVIGVSAGGATADIMAATYPDIYAAVGILAGCEYRGLPCLGAPSAVPPSLSAQLAYQASCPQVTQCAARVVPFIVENGDADPAVPVGNAFEVVQQWQLYDAFARAGQVNLATVPSGPCAAQPLVVPTPVVAPQVPKSPYDVYEYSLDGAPCSPHSDDVLGELYIVHGELHAWPGGAPVYVNTTDNQYEIYTNPGGPDLTDIAYQFFVQHPCKVVHGVCAPASSQRQSDDASAPQAHSIAAPGVTAAAASSDGPSFTAAGWAGAMRRIVRAVLSALPAV